MFRQANKSKVGTVCLVTGMLALLSGGLLWAGEGNAGNPGVLPPDSTPFGMSYPEWHVACIDWTMSIPEAANPMLNADDPEDQDTAARPVWIGPYDAAAGQWGHVWFLAGTYKNGWAVEREATIPAGTPLCIPLQNSLVWGWPPIPAAEAWMRSYLDLLLDTAVVSCEIDGVPVNNLQRYRHQSPAVPVVLGEENLFGLPSGEYGMVVDDGYYLVLAPLSVGTHTIHWTAMMDIIPYWNPWDAAPVGPFPQGIQDVTYQITVVPSK
jgi:hypothetical protein